MEMTIPMMITIYTTLMTVLVKGIQTICDHKDEMKDDGEGLYVVHPASSFIRKRKLSLPFVILSQLTMGNMGMQRELLKKFNMSVDAPRTSALNQQLEKIQPYTMQFLFEETKRAFSTFCAGVNIFALKVYACDGSELNVPTDKSNETTKKTKGNRDYNSAHVHFLVDVLTGLVQDVKLGLRNFEDERAAFVRMINEVCEVAQPWTCLFMADRGYEAWFVFAGFVFVKQFFLIRCKDIESNGLLSSLNLSGEFDKLITVTLTISQINAVKRCKDEIKGFLIKVDKVSCSQILNEDNQFFTFSFRVIRFKLPNGEYECLATNLPCSKFPTSLVIAMYALRWAIEVNIKRIKTLLSFNNLHHRKTNLQEIEAYGKLTVYNIVAALTWSVNQFFSGGPTGSTGIKILERTIREVHDLAFADDDDPDVLVRDIKDALNRSLSNEDITEILDGIDLFYEECNKNKEKESKRQQKADEARKQMMRSYISYFDQMTSFDFLECSESGQYVNTTEIPFTIEDAPALVQPKLRLLMNGYKKKEPVVRANFAIAALAILTDINDECAKHVPEKYSTRVPGNTIFVILRFDMLYELGRFWKRDLRAQRNMSSQCQASVA